jgi:hypothetical protein
MGGFTAMLDLSFDYAGCVKNSEKVSWKLDDVFPADTRLDFSRPFLPAALAGGGGLEGLSDTERRTLNQITANAYLNLFQFVEEYILAMTVQHAHAELFGDHDAIRALCRFAEEEAKHQALFWRYRAAFDRDVGQPCGVLGSAAAVAGVILGKSPIAVLLVTCHLELMTQQHFTECVRDDGGIDPLFAKLLRFHWLEEAQHAKIDALELEKLLASATPEQISTAFDEYFGILDAFESLLGNQADFDVASLEQVSGRALSDDGRAEVRAAQLAAYCRTFLWYGMTNPVFAGYVAAMSEPARRRLAEKAARYA